jgi:hypothetical protein
MQPDRTPRQPEARQDDDLPQELLEAVFAGECGDPIWEYAADPAQARVPALPAQPRHDDETGPREPRVRAGRVIDLVDRRARQTG